MFGKRLLKCACRFSPSITNNIKLKFGRIEYKIRLFLCTPLRYMGGVELQSHAFFNLGTRWRWLVRFTSSNEITKCFKILRVAYSFTTINIQRRPTCWYRQGVAEPS